MPPTHSQAALPEQFQTCLHASIPCLVATAIRKWRHNEGMHCLHLAPAQVQGPVCVNATLLLLRMVHVAVCTEVSS